jgi:chromosome segregation ATPase
VENALGHNLQLVLTEQPSSAQEILAELTANKSGRASVAALAIQQYQDEKQLAFAGEMAPCFRPDHAGLQSGQIVHAMSVISAEPSVEPLLKSLLGRTFIASDLGTATAQIQNGHAGCDFVTWAANC